MVQYPSRVRHVQDGEPVDAGTTSRATQALQAQTGYLREALAASDAGRALLHRDASLDPTVLVGQAVFWNADEKRYEQAMAGVENDVATSVLRPTKASDTLGLVLNKGATADCGDVVLMGLVHFDDLANTIDGAVVPGRYYLSAADPGKLVAQRPGASVAVCYVFGPLDACNNDVWVFVLPQMRDFLEDHIHYQFQLTALPAGEHNPPVPNDPHAITAPDASLPGWLPANHASFAGNAPAGACFGYNLSQHLELSRIWPPIPIAACLLELFQADAAGKMEGHGRVLAELVQFTAHGIWWMSDCYGEVPWPTDYDNAESSSSSSESSSSESSSSESSSSAACPEAPDIRLLLSFIKMTFATDRTVVTSLQPDVDQPLDFVNCDGVPATTGDLFAQLQLGFFIDDEEHYGGTVLKELLSGFKFGVGWVAEGLIAGSSTVQLSSTHQRYQTPGNPATAVVHQGLVTVDVQTEATERAVTPQIVRLGDALEREYRNAPYIGLPSGRDSGVRLRFNIPFTGLPTNPQFSLRAHLLALSAGTFPALTTTYYRLARADAGAIELLEGDSALPNFDADIIVLANHTYEVESDAVAIAAGDVVYVSVLRAAATGAYDNDVGFLRFNGIIVGA